MARKSRQNKASCRHKLTQLFIFSITAVLLLLCSCERKSDDSVSFKIKLSADEIGVGLDDLIAVDVQVDPDAAGLSCQFTATDGTFTNGKADTIDTIDGNGHAHANWKAPVRPGNVEIAVRVGPVSGHVNIEVTPVPDEIRFDNLPDSLQESSAVLIEVSVPILWVGKPVEIVAAQGQLIATGPVADQREIGTRILPIIDNQGKASFLLQAPSQQVNLILTASLFGTIETRYVRIYP